MPVLILGTAQWGADYGVTNVIGRPADADVERQVVLARECGITSLDTASAYGDAHERIRILAPEFAVVTKVSGARPDQVAELVDDARVALGRPMLNGVLLHDWDALDARTADAAARELELQRALGVTSAVGVSVYDEGAVARALGTFESLDIVQVPANALDRRLDSSAILDEVRVRGGRVQVRSALLQGVLGNEFENPFAAHPAVQAWFAHCRAQGVTPLATALAHVKALPWCDEVVIGVADASQLEQIIDAWSSVESHLAPVSLGSEDLALIDPRTWQMAS